MPDEKKSRLPEINFLPPLDMVLTFFDRTFRRRGAQDEKKDEEQKQAEEKNIERLIEKLSEKEE